MERIRTQNRKTTFAEFAREMNPPANRAGLLVCSLQHLRTSSEMLVVACTKVIWEETERLQARLDEPFLMRRTLDFQRLSPIPLALHDTGFDSRQSRARQRRFRHDQDA
jgi:hypothetical protein